MRVIISGGGTGGHIFPAVAIAKTLQSRYPTAEILFVGAVGKMEMEKVPAAGFNIIGLPIVGIQRRLTWKNLLVPFKLWKSMRIAKKTIKDFKPDVAVGVGGYASGPLLKTASALGIKTLIQEQNSYPGITNKILSKSAHKICVAYDGLDRFFPKEKIIITGNPVRTEMVKLEGKRPRAMEHFDLDPQKKTLLVIGGSLGARTINRAIQSSIVELLKEDIQVIWQTGKEYFETAKAFASGYDGVKVHAFIQEMDLAYAAADIIVSRAGAMSISELSLINKPVILVPSPNVAEDHQTKNAMSLVNRNAAILVKDEEAGDILGKEVSALFKDEQRMTLLSANISALGLPHAAEDIVAEIIKLI